MDHDFDPEVDLRQMATATKGVYCGKQAGRLGGGGNTFRHSHVGLPCDAAARVTRCGAIPVPIHAYGNVDLVFARGRAAIGCAPDSAPTRVQYGSVQLATLEFHRLN
jgi:hypothetical protein